MSGHFDELKKRPSLRDAEAAEAERQLQVKLVEAVRPWIDLAKEHRRTVAAALRPAALRSSVAFRPCSSRPSYWAGATS